MIETQLLYDFGSTLLSVIGGATILLQVVAPLTKTKMDNKLLRFLLKLLEVVSLNKRDGDVLVRVKGDTKE